jgi:hypothetical protein
MIRQMPPLSGVSPRPMQHWPCPVLNLALSTTVALIVGLSDSLQANPVEQLSPSAATPVVVESPGPVSKVEESVKRKGQPSVFGAAAKPGFFAVIEQTSSWTFSRTRPVATGAAWGTGPGVGATFVGLGVSGTINGSEDTLLTWSAQLGPQFQHVYNVPGNELTQLRMDLYSSLSPLRGDDLNIYAIWRGIAGADGLDQARLVNTVRTGIIYSFAGSRIFPDAKELINLPEKGLYARVEPTWIFGLDGQLSQVQTQAYVGLSETWYPFTFAVEVGPQFVQLANQELQTNLGSFFDFGYVINKKTRAYLRYRPSLSFGGNAYPAANQVLQAGVNYRF